MKTKVISYTALLYGADFLEYAIRSVIDVVDEHWIIYSPTGSHGHRTDQPCPDTRDELYACAQRGAGSKLRWVDAGPFEHEGKQREHIYTLAPTADVILWVDSDEVYADGLAAGLVWTATRPMSLRVREAKRFRVPFVHLWRSFSRGFAHDPAYPHRVICPKALGDDEETVQTDLRIWHFGYSQRSEIVKFKMETHGHKNEFRKDCDWFSDVFIANRQTDCHPVGSDAWNCEDIDQSKLPSVLANHPYRNMKVIP